MYWRLRAIDAVPMESQQQALLAQLPARYLPVELDGFSDWREERRRNEVALLTDVKARYGQPILPLVALLHAYPEWAENHFLNELFYLPACFALLDQLLPGAAMEEIIDRGAHLFDLIDEAQFSAHFIASLLKCPEDDKPDNYIAEWETDDRHCINRIYLRAIDNDRNFVDTLLKTRYGEYIIPIKSLIYVLQKAVAKPCALSQTALQGLLRRPAVILLQWLSALQAYHAYYEALYHTGVLDLFRNPQLSGKLAGFKLMDRIYEMGSHKSVAS